MAGLWPAGWNALPEAAPGEAVPLVLTVALPAQVQRAADALRQRLDPERAARTPAHLTLFRHLPGREAPALLADCRALADRAPHFTLGPARRVEGALHAPVSSEALSQLRAELAERWHGLLMPGDAAPPRLHLTLAGRQPRDAPLPPPLPAGPHRAGGLLLWRYRGPARPSGEAFWSPLVAVAFRR
jgi:hypothetical protein